MADGPTKNGSGGNQKPLQKSRTGSETSILIPLSEACLADTFIGQIEPCLFNTSSSMYVVGEQKSPAPMTTGTNEDSATCPASKYQMSQGT